MNPSHFSLPPSRGFFVTGTDTGVGKTHVACLLVEAFKKEGLRVAVMKPVAAGVEADGVNADVRLLMAAANVEAPLELVNPYCFAPAIAPHLAAQQAGVAMRMEVIEKAYAQLAGMSDVVVVEGAGGFLVPFNAESGMEQIPVRLKLPVIMVVGLRLGCLNHALLTAEAIRNRGLSLAGWVANQIDPEMAELDVNLTALRSLLCSPCMGNIPRQGNSFDSPARGSDLILNVLGLG